MPQTLESARDLVTHMADRFPEAAAQRLTGPKGGIDGLLIDAQAGEAWSNASDAHILAFIPCGSATHHQWHDGKLVHDGPIPPRSINIVRAGLRPSARLDAPLRVLHLYLPHHELARRAAGVGWGGRPADLEIVDPGFASDPLLASLGEHVIALLQTHRSVDRLLRDTLVDTVASRVLQRWSNLGSGVAWVRRGGLSPTQVRRVCEAMDADLDGDIALEALAKVAGCSPSHLSRAFRQSMGMPPFQWMVQRRIERAKTLLLDKEIALVDIALAVGFAAQPQFTTAFRRVTGLTPGAWRRSRLAPGG